MEQRKKLSTDEIFTLLEKTSSFAEAEQQAGSFDGISLESYLEELLTQYHTTIPQVIRLSLLSKSYVYQIFGGNRQPERDTVIRLALAIGCNLDETQRLLKLAGRGALYPRLRRDAALVFCLEQGYSLLQTAEFLEEAGEAALV